MGFDSEGRLASAAGVMSTYRPPEAGPGFEHYHIDVTGEGDYVRKEDIEYTYIPVVTSGKGLEPQVVGWLIIDGHFVVGSKYKNDEISDEGEMVVYPDGSKGHAPQIIGQYDVAYSKSYVVLNTGEKQYYSSDYKYRIVNALNPNADTWRDPGISGLNDAYKAGYSSGYSRKAWIYPFILFSSPDDYPQYSVYWFHGYRRGKSDRRNYYSSYLDFEFFKNIPYP